MYEDLFFIRSVLKHTATIEDIRFSFWVLDVTLQNHLDMINQDEPENIKFIKGSVPESHVEPIIL